MRTYYYQENKGQFPNELPHMVMSNHTDKCVASHNVKETTLQHIDKNNKSFPYGFRTTKEIREIILKKSAK